MQHDPICFVGRLSFYNLRRSHLFMNTKKLELLRGVFQNPPEKKKKGVATGRALRVLPRRKQRRNPNAWHPRCHSKRSYSCFKNQKKKRPGEQTWNHHLQLPFLEVSFLVSIWYEYWYESPKKTRCNQKKSANNKNCCCNQCETRCL